MSQVSMTVRMDSQLKRMFDALCAEFGMSSNTAKVFLIFMISWFYLFLSVIYFFHTLDAGGTCKTTKKIFFLRLLSILTPNLGLLTVWKASYDSSMKEKTKKRHNAHAHHVPFICWFVNALA